MNASHSPTINIADPFPAIESAGQRAGGPRSDGGGGSFDAVYDNERTSLSREKPNKDINNNTLDRKEPAKKTASPDTEAASDSDAGGEVRPESDRTPLLPTQNQKTDLPEDGLQSDELTQEDALFAGIATPRPVADDTVGRGEHLPSGGKNLPVIDASTSKEALLPKTPGDAAAREDMDQSEEGLDRAVTRLGTQNSSNRNLYGSDSSDSLKQDRLMRLSVNSSDYFHIEDAMDITPGKNSAEAMLESLALLGSISSKDTSTTLAQSSPGISAAIAATNSDSQLASSQTLASTAAESLDASLNIRGNTTDWSQAIGDKIRWMRNASVSTAELHLNPAELGSIEIKIVTEDQQARVSFITSSTVAQEMIEESLSKLKELLADHGIALDQSDISQKENQNEFAQGDSQPPATEPGIETSFEQEATLSTGPPVTSRIGQVDHYV